MSQTGWCAPKGTAGVATADAAAAPAGWDTGTPGWRPAVLHYTCEKVRRAARDGLERLIHNCACACMKARALGCASSVRSGSILAAFPAVFLLFPSQSLCLTVCRHCTLHSVGITTALDAQPSQPANPASQHTSGCQAPAQPCISINLTCRGPQTHPHLARSPGVHTQQSPGGAAGG